MLEFGDDNVDVLGEGPFVQGMRAFTAGRIPSRVFVGNSRKLRGEGST